MILSRTKTLLVTVVLTGSTAIISQASPPQETQTVAENVPVTFVRQPDPAVPKTQPKPDTTSVTNMNRVGVQTAQTLALTMDDAIRRALSNNNDVEVSRIDVRISDTSLRSQLGVYDPVFTVSPNFSHSQTTGGAGTNDFRVSSNVQGQIRPGGGNYQGFFNNNRTENAFAQAQASSGSPSVTAEASPA